MGKKERAWDMYIPYVAICMQVLMHNVKRITGLVNSLSAGMTWIRHISNWESKLHSSLALLVGT